MDTNVEKKWYRWVAIAVALLMLATLAVPMNVSKISADSGLRNPRIAEDGTVSWDCVYFGRYPQSSDGNDGFNNEPIKWRVLSVDGNKALLLADKGLDCQRYNEQYTDITWEFCTLRSWLNGYDSEANTCNIDYSSDSFMSKAFNKEEQSAILETTESVTNTKNKILIPHPNDVCNQAYGFKENDEENQAREVKATDYAKKQGAEINTSEQYKGNARWWLRAPTKIWSYAACVNHDGHPITGYFGYPVHYKTQAIRPMLYLNLDSDVWSYATPVTIEGKRLQFNGHTYKIFTDLNGSWEEAKEYCESKHGHLATITSKEENEAIYNYMIKEGLRNTYFGLSNKKDGKWEWVTGEAVDYTNWAEGEPSGGHEHYGMFYSGLPATTWNDGDGNPVKRAICEWDYDTRGSFIQNSDIIKAVERYTSDLQFNKLTEIMESDWSDERKFREVNDLFHSMGMSDPKEGIEYLGQTADERFAYRGLTTSEIYCGDNFIKWLFSEEGFPARSAYYSSALLLN